MRVPRFIDGNGVNFNMTPMIDVVFLLIIFFLVSSHLAQQEVQVDLDLPEAQSASPTDLEPPHVTLNVRPDGQCLWGQRAVTLEELRHLLAERRRVVGGPLVVRIRGDEHAAYRTVEPLLRTCAKTGVREVRFAVLPKAEAS